MIFVLLFAFCTASPFCSMYGCQPEGNNAVSQRDVRVAVSQRLAERVAVFTVNTCEHVVAVTAELVVCSGADGVLGFDISSGKVAFQSSAVLGGFTPFVDEILVFSANVSHFSLIEVVNTSNAVPRWTIYGPLSTSPVPIVSQSMLALADANVALTVQTIGTTFASMRLDADILHAPTVSNDVLLYTTRAGLVALRSRNALAPRLELLWKLPSTACLERSFFATDYSRDAAYIVVASSAPCEPFIQIFSFTNNHAVLLWRRSLAPTAKRVFMGSDFDGRLVACFSSVCETIRLVDGHVEATAPIKSSPSSQLTVLAASTGLPSVLVPIGQTLNMIKGNSTLWTASLPGDALGQAIPMLHGNVAVAVVVATTAGIIVIE